MTQVLQSGQHPDADQLSAFVEHALPPHESQQMLAHLAVCQDCREIAFLAQPEVIDKAVAGGKRIATRRWFSGWNLALPTGLAVAFFVILGLHLHNVSTAKNRAQEDKTARLEQSVPLSQYAPLPPQAVPSTPIPAPIRKASVTTRLTGDSLSSVSSSHSISVQPGPKGATLNGSSASREGVAAPMLNQTAVSGAGIANEVHPAVGGSSFRPASPSAAVPAPASTPTAQSAAMSNVDAVHRELRSSAAQYNSTAVTAQSNLNPPFQAAPGQPASVPGTANETVTVTDAPATLETDSNASSEVIAGRAIGSLAAPAFKMKKQPSLPSHLPALSTVSNTRQELAIDTRGSLFRSEDAGVSWQPVPSQWIGRAVKLQLASTQGPPSLAAGANSTAAAAAAKGSPTGVAQPMFELVNEMGTVWISTDGQTWKRK